MRWITSDIDRLLPKIAEISMLHPEALERLAQLARVSRGGILEIGPYIGGRR